MAENKENENGSDKKQENQSTIKDPLIKNIAQAIGEEDNTPADEVLRNGLIHNYGEIKGNEIYKKMTTPQSSDVKEDLTRRN